MYIEGRSGQIPDTRKVHTLERLCVSATTQPEIHELSKANKVFSWCSAYTTGGANEEVIYVKNDSSENLIIHSIVLGTAVNALFTLYKVTGTAGGTTITGVALNTNHVQDPTATSYGDASVTGLTIGNRLWQMRVLANHSIQYDCACALIIPPGEAIAISNSGTGACDATIVGNFNGN
jgi:hypothetical protein